MLQEDWLAAAFFFLSSCMAWSILSSKMYLHRQIREEGRGAEE